MEGSEVVYLGFIPKDVFINIVMTVLGTFIGFIIRGWTLTGKEKIDVHTNQSTLSHNLSNEFAQEYKNFHTAIQEYINANSIETEHFIKISLTGDVYFSKINSICGLAKAKVINMTYFENTILPKIKEAAEISLPAYYIALKNISVKKGFSYDGKLEKENYKGIEEIIATYYRFEYSNIMNKWSNVNLPLPPSP